MIIGEIFSSKVPINAALLWQKEASDIPSHSELLMFSYFTYCALFPGQILCIKTHPAKRNVKALSHIADLACRSYTGAQIC